jgi:predicted nucleic acid-binding protein
VGKYSEGIHLILIADSSALITLAVCDSLYLLDLLFKEVKVPRAVYREVIRESKKEADKLKDYLLNKIVNLENERSIIIKEGTIEIGELEAMVLYKQLNANRLLVDDRRARKVAELNQIKIIGSLGVLLLSKKEGHITNIKSRIAIIKNSDIYLSEELLQRIMSLAGES